MDNLVTRLENNAGLTEEQTIDALAVVKDFMDQQNLSIDWKTYLKGKYTKIVNRTKKIDHAPEIHVQEPVDFSDRVVREVDDISETVGKNVDDFSDKITGNVEKMLSDMKEGAKNLTKKMYDKLND